MTKYGCKSQSAQYSGKLMFIYCFSIFGAWRPAYAPGKSTVPSHAPAVQYSVQHAAVHVRKLADFTFLRFLFFLKFFLLHILVVYKPYFMIIIYHTLYIQ